MSIKFHKQNKGSALLITLSLIALLSAVAIMSVDRAHTDVTMSFNQVHEDQAFYAADAGIEHAAKILADSAKWRTGFVNETLGQAIYSVAVIDSVTIPALKDTVLLRSTAKCDGAVANIEAFLGLEYYRPYQYAVYGDEEVIMEGNTCTDSYASDSGSYATTMEQTMGDVGSNNKLLLQGSAVVGGDVDRVKGAYMTIQPGVTVMGTVNENLPETPVTIIHDSLFTIAKSISNAPAGFSGSGYTYDGSTKKLVVSGTGTVTLAGGTYFFSSLDVNSSAKLKIAAGAKVNIFVSGDVQVSGNGAINSGGAPSALNIFSQGNSIQLDDYAEIHAGIIGPTAHLQIRGSSNVYGSALTGMVLVSGSSCFHYDRALSRVEVNAVKGMKVLAWHQN